ncbi:MAG: DUF3800 domain-containing protein [Planctomycetes bacterium]|nr:DUF3800 domain-containing protein [Planctomycetota bacterium]
MQEPVDKTAWYFVDEAGDPVFFDRWGETIVGQLGCSPILILGFIEVTDPHSARQSLAALRSKLLTDSYLSAIPSMKKTAISFHAKDDCPEVRHAVFREIANMDFRSQFVVARKRETTFRKSFKSSPSRFYDHLISLLFRNVLHRCSRNWIYFSKRGDRVRQKPLEDAISKGLDEFQAIWKTKIETQIRVQCQTPSNEPCLQIIDYMNWAVYRAFTKGEMRYFDFVRQKVELVLDLYDRDKYPKNYYTREKNPFDINKTSPL